ncbi:hypothetical protein ACI65C_006492 [Semiaphis heraclei]
MKNLLTPQSDFYGQSKIISTSSSPFKISNVEIEGFTESQSNIFHQLSSDTSVLSSSDKNDANKRMKRFQKFDTIEVEDPIKIFLAGAKFREKL